MSSRLTLWALVVLSCATPAAAQLASQTALVGTVTDSGGAVVPGAQVVAVNTNTGDTYETTTTAERYYNIQFVRTGTYEITVSVTGFQTFKATGVQVTGNQVVRTDAALKVGGLTESVNVEAKAQLLTTDSATVSETIGKRAIVELPLNGRNVWSLASTTPGVLAGVNSDIGLSFRGAGQREIQNSLSLDGINSSANLLASSSLRPIADAVEEVQGFRPACRRHLSSEREDRAARWFRDLLQPEPDELVHVPDQQSTARGRVHLHVGYGQSNVVVRPSHRHRGSGIAPPTSTTRRTTRRPPIPPKK
jgi:hypothetical protein